MAHLTLWAFVSDNSQTKTVDMLGRTTLLLIIIGVLLRSIWGNIFRKALPASNAHQDERVGNKSRTIGKVHRLLKFFSLSGILEYFSPQRKKAKPRMRGRRQNQEGDE